MPPSDDGACSILSYEIQIDDGLGGAIVAIDTDLVGSKAYLREQH